MILSKLNMKNIKFWQNQLILVSEISKSLFPLNHSRRSQAKDNA